MLAIIPARGGSKGIHRKNIKNFCGKPLIFWTIEAAIKASGIDRIILSTEDHEIAEICSQYKEVEIPFMRPNDLAEDTSIAIDTYIYTIENLRKEQSLHYSDFVVLLPTSPLRSSKDIDKAIDIFINKDADSVIGCRELEFPRNWILDINHQGKIYKESKHKELSNRQDNREIHIPNGSIYILNYEKIKKHRTYYFDNSYAYIMPSHRSVDIDTAEDFHYAEYLKRKIDDR